MIEPLHIFIIEDDAIILMGIEALLEDAGHIIVGTALSAHEAIDKIQDARPELVFLDLRLKDGSSGIDVARALRDKTDVTVVFLTANAKDITEDMEGAAAVIGKPFSGSLLEASIAFLEECVRRPPPKQLLPHGMRLAPAFLARLDGIRAAL